MTAGAGQFEAVKIEEQKLTDSLHGDVLFTRKKCDTRTFFALLGKQPMSFYSNCLL
jgi:hypothetical protein